MKTAVVVLIALMSFTAAQAPAAVQPINQDYHEIIGIPEAARIRAAEESPDFDGSSMMFFDNLEEFPYVGKLVITLQNGKISVCSSSLISNTRALTAAHCWIHGRRTARQMELVLGSPTFFTGGKRMTTNRVATHPNYDTDTLANDIGLVKVNRVAFNNNIRPVQMSSGPDQFAGQNAVAPGSGRSWDAVIITNAICALFYGTKVVTDSALCVIDAGNHSTYHGASGGPLTIGNILIGVSSRGARGRQRGMAAVYTRVSSFNTWIRQNM